MSTGTFEELSRSSRLRRHWHTELARRWLPVLPKQIKRDDKAYSLAIGHGQAAYFHMKEVLVSFTAQYTGQAAMQLAQWLEDNAMRERRLTLPSKD